MKHVAPVLVEQHLLLVGEGIGFKILVVHHEALNGFGTECLQLFFTAGGRWDPSGPLGCWTWEQVLRYFQLLKKQALIKENY